MDIDGKIRYIVSQRKESEWLFKYVLLLKKYSRKDIFKYKVPSLSPMVLELLLKSIYFFLPAYCANLAPVLLKWIPFFDKPVNKNLFGAHKTWRGIIVAAMVGTVVFWLQKYLYRVGFQQYALIEYSDFSVWLGFCLGVGAILGDLAKSYYKRKGKIPPGERWIPFDQLDFVVGGIIGSFFLYVPNAEVVMILLVVSFFLHIAATRIGYWLGMRKEGW